MTERERNKSQKEVQGKTCKIKKEPGWVPFLVGNFGLYTEFLTEMTNLSIISTSKKFTRWGKNPKELKMRNFALAASTILMLFACNLHMDDSTYGAAGQQNDISAGVPHYQHDSAQSGPIYDVAQDFVPVTFVWNLEAGVKQTSYDLAGTLMDMDYQQGNPFAGSIAVFKYQVHCRFETKDLTDDGDQMVVEHEFEGFEFEYGPDKRVPPYTINFDSKSYGEIIGCSPKIVGIGRFRDIKSPMASLDQDLVKIVTIGGMSAKVGNGRPMDLVVLPMLTSEPLIIDMPKGVEPDPEVVREAIENADFRLRGADPNWVFIPSVYERNYQ